MFPLVTNLPAVLISQLDSAIMQIIMTVASTQVTVIDVTMMIALTLSCVSFLLSFDSVESSVRPVILIPGFIQSRLDAKITSDFKSDNLFCQLNTIDQSSEARYQYVFVNLKFVTSREAFLCLKDILTLDFDPRTSLAIEPIGASIIPRQFGNVIGTFGVNDILTLNDSTSYFKDIVLKFVSQGYEANVDIKAAVFDFRVPFDQLIGWRIGIKNMIESMYQRNQKPVSLVSHSIGCIITYQFLRTQSHSWKSKYIYNWIPVSGVFGGTISTLNSFTFGKSPMTFPFSTPKDIQELTRTWPSLPPLIPSPTVFGNESLITFDYNPRLTVTSQSYGRFFQQLNDPIGYKYYLQNKDVLNNIQNPGVDVHCIHGSGLKTDSRLNYRLPSDFPLSPQIIEGPGDTLIELKSLAACTMLRPSDRRPNGAKFTRKVLIGSHEGILHQPEFLSYLYQLTL